MRRYFFLASALLAASSFAIEAPQPTTPAPTQPAAPVQTSVTPNDESAFYQVLQTSAHHRNLTGLKKADRAKQVGAAIAQKCKVAGIEKVVFDRNGYIYHGRVKALADAAREAGLNF